MKERFFISTPIATDRTQIIDGSTFPIYLDSSKADKGLEMKWSGKHPLPAVGDKIFITMNGIGYAYVVGYFESEGYLGVMTKPTRPPKWLRDQHKRDLLSGRKMPDWYRDGIGCEFGTEIAPKRPRRTVML